MLFYDFFTEMEKVTAYYPHSGLVRDVSLLFLKEYYRMMCIP